MKEFKVPSDRTVDSTDNNEFAAGLRDETMLAEDAIENALDDVPLDDLIPGAIDETGEADRPLYDEMGVGTEGK